MKKKKAQRLGVPNQSSRNYVAKHQFQRGGAHKDEKLDYSRKEKHRGRRYTDVDLLPYVIARMKRVSYYFFHPIKHWRSSEKKKNS